MYVPDEVGIIVDLQCGGWSTNILTNDGKLFTVGILDAADGRENGEPVDHFTQLHLFAQHGITGVRQFSAGRCHILGLDDNGYVWSWDRVGQSGCLLSFENSLKYARQATRVVAGWGDSSAYIPGTGIIYWAAISTRNDQEVQNFDRTVHDSLVPATGYRNSDLANTAQAFRESESGTTGALIEEDVGEVLVHVLLENYIIFITHLSKLFAYRLSREPHDQRLPCLQMLEIPGYSGQGREFKDLQGSFRTFAVFTNSGEVLSGNTDYLNRVFEEAKFHAATGHLTDLGKSPVPYSRNLITARPPNVHALQHKGVISLAFGDWHFHALHSDGTITAHGVETGCCGALGLGSTSAGARFRGVKTSRTPMNRDGKLLANRNGRQVWFEAEKRDWLEWMENWIRTPTARPHFPEVFAILNNEQDKQAAFSEWVEQEGRCWSDGPVNSQIHALPKWSSQALAVSAQTVSIPTAEDALSAYFAISIAAAGHHTGSLVLVDDSKAETNRRKWIAGDESEPGRIRGEYVWEKNSFPRIRLPDGYEFPGEGEIRPWRDGMPSMDQLGLPMPPPT